MQGRRSARRRRVRFTRTLTCVAIDFRRRRRGGARAHARWATRHAADATRAVRTSNTYARRRRDRYSFHAQSAGPHVRVRRRHDTADRRGGAARAGGDGADQRTAWWAVGASRRVVRGRSWSAWQRATASRSRPRCSRHTKPWAFTHGRSPHILILLGRQSEAQSGSNMVYMLRGFILVPPRALDLIGRGDMGI